MRPALVLLATLLLAACATTLPGEDGSVGSSPASSVGERAGSSLDPATPRKTSVTGRIGCLPKRGPGPHTMECAMGLRADDGRHYALDATALGDAGVFKYEGDHIRVEGQMTPIVAVSSDRWATYDIVGIIQVVSIGRVE
jgi:hypothetical protein